MSRSLKVYEFSNLGFYQMFGLKVESKLGDGLGWNSELFCVSDWAGDPETRISFTGLLIPVSWL
jgi:hypothetical protein